nr:unnamed protein product [Digitaria exilis]
MDVKVIVSVYEERPRRRRPISHGASTATSAPRQAGRGYSRRALLLAYAQQLRRRRRQQQNGPPLLEWSEWKAGRVASGDLAMTTRAAGRRSWCSRLRSCVRLWVRTFLLGASRIREDASCRK